MDLQKSLWHNCHSQAQSVCSGSPTQKAEDTSKLLRTFFTLSGKHFIKQFILSVCYVKLGGEGLCFKQLRSCCCCSSLFNAFCIEWSLSTQTEKLKIQNINFTSLYHIRQMFDMPRISLFFNKKGKDFTVCKKSLYKNIHTLIYVASKK